MRRRFYPTGQIVQEQHKPANGYTGLEPIDNIRLAMAATRNLKEAPRCSCGYLFTFHAINKAKSTGSIKCPCCKNIIKVDNLK